MQATFASSNVTGGSVVANTPNGGCFSGFFVDLTLTATAVTNCTVAVLTQAFGPFDVQRDLSPFGAGGGGGLFLYDADVTISGGSTVRSMMCTSPC